MLDRFPLARAKRAFLRSGMVLTVGCSGLRGLPRQSAAAVHLSASARVLLVLLRLGRCGVLLLLLHCSQSQSHTDRCGHPGMLFPWLHPCATERAAVPRPSQPSTGPLVAVNGSGQLQSPSTTDVGQPWETAQLTHSLYTTTTL